MIFGAIIAPDVLLESERVKPAMQPTEMVSARKPPAAALQNRKEVESLLGSANGCCARTEGSGPRVFQSVRGIAERYHGESARCSKRNKNSYENTSGYQDEIISSRDVRSRALEVTWHRLSTRARAAGSANTTRRDLWSHDTTGEISSSRAEGADEVRIAKFSREAKVAFQSWILKNTAATSRISPRSDSSIWVRFAPELYETKDSAETAAVRLPETINCKPVTKAISSSPFGTMRR